MSSIHICKFSAQKASRIEMQKSWVNSDVMDIDGNNGSIKISYANIYKAIKLNMYEVYIFHMQSTATYLIFALAVLKLLNKNAKIVYDIHDLNEKTKHDNFYMKFRYVVFLMVELIIFSFKEVSIITVSRGLSHIYEKRYGRRPAVVYNIPNWSADFECGVGGEGVVYFGQITKVRLPISLLNALAEAKCTINIYGVMKEDDADYISNFEILKSNGSLVFHGEYSPSDMSFLRKYRVLLMIYEEGELNIRYCLPNKLFQALGSGLSCLVSKNMAEMRLLFRNYPEFLRGSDSDVESITESLRYMSKGSLRGEVNKYAFGLLGISRDNYKRVIC